LEEAGVGKGTERSLDKRRLEPGKKLEDQVWMVWIREGLRLERNWKITCGRWLDTGKELEDTVRMVWIREGWSRSRLETGK
jgi:hypothetical protein